MKNNPTSDLTKSLDSPEITMLIHSAPVSNTELKISLGTRQVIASLVIHVHDVHYRVGLRTTAGNDEM